MSLKKIDVVFSIDENYVQHFCVALTSLLENSLGSIDRIFLISDIEEERLLKLTFDFISRKYNKRIIHINITKDLGGFTISGYISKAAYFRLFLPELLPLDLDRVLYLDSDIIVNRSIEDLIYLDYTMLNKPSSSNYFDYTRSIEDEQEFYLFAVSEVRFQDRDRLIRLGLSGEKYFNSGMLVINLKKWRANNVVDILIRIALKYKDQLRYHDQDVLNIAFENCWGELCYTYNSINLEYLSKVEQKGDYHIIHFTGETKPWHLTCRHLYNNVYWYYLRKTPYKYYIPKDVSVKNIINKLLFYFKN